VISYVNLLKFSTGSTKAQQWIFIVKYGIATVETVSHSRIAFSSRLILLFLIIIKLVRWGPSPFSHLNILNAW
jgi:hypothetical protein